MIDVALCMLTLVPGGMGGSETYARELTRQLHGIPDLRAVAYVPRSAQGFSRGIPETVVNRIRGKSSTPERLRSVITATAFSRSIRQRMSGAAIVHYPFTVPAPRPSRHQSFIQTVLDVQHLDHPELFSGAELVYRKYFYDAPARRADLIITISEFAKQRIMHHLGIDPERITVAHLGVDRSQFVPNYGAREDFVLYPARSWPHKNHARLVKAMTLLRRERPSLRLVLTGGGLDALKGLPDWVERRGLIPADQLRSLYQRAAVMVFPSLYEGFGLPPLEAMASGCPVAASALGAIPEVCGDAAVLFDPRDPGAIAKGILQAIERGPVLSRTGGDQVAKFTWEHCRDLHVEAYREVIRRR